MKNILRGVSIFFVATIVVLIVLDMSGNNVRKGETATIANSATYDAIRVKLSENITDEEELVAEVIKQVALSKQSDSDIKIQILGIDAENGMLDVNIIQTIRHVNGKTTTTEERRTVILEEETVPDAYASSFNSLDDSGVLENSDNSNITEETKDSQNTGNIDEDKSNSVEE